MLENGNYFGRQFNQSLEELAAAQQRFRAQAEIGKAPPYFLTSTTLTDDENDPRRVSLATVDGRFDEDEPVPYGELFTFTEDPKPKITSDILRLRDREVVVKVLLGKLGVNKLNAHNSWFRLVDQTVDVVNNDRYEIDPRWTTFGALHRRLSPSKERRWEVVHNRANIGESHRVSFNAGHDGRGKSIIMCKTINPLTGRTERHVMHPRYEHLVTVGEPLDYVIDQPLLLQKVGDILVKPDAETRTQADELYKSLDSLIEDVASQKSLFVEFDIYADATQIHKANAKIKTGSKTEIYRLHPRELHKLRFGNDVDRKHPQGCFITHGIPYTNPSGVLIYTCSIIGPAPKDIPRRLLWGESFRGGYVKNHLLRRTDIERAPSLRGAGRGSVFRFAQKDENQIHS